MRLKTGRRRVCWVATLRSAGTTLGGWVQDLGWQREQGFADSLPMLIMPLMCDKPHRSSPGATCCAEHDTPQVNQAGLRQYLSRAKSFQAGGW